jgi:hypothetical protein
MAPHRGVCYARTMPDDPTGPSNPLQPFGDVAGVAKVLVDRVSNAIGMVYEPYHIRRIAAANQEVRQDQALADIEITDLQKRAARRWLAEESRKQTNIESAVTAAVSLLEDKAKPEDIDEDWLIEWLALVGKASNVNVQRIWSRMLAGEGNEPGSFSKMTLHRVAAMGPRDVALLNELFSMVGMLGGRPAAFVFDHTDKRWHHDKGLKFEALSNLESMGFIRLAAPGTLYSRSFTVDDDGMFRVHLEYDNRAVMLETNAPDAGLMAPDFDLTEPRMMATNNRALDVLETGQVLLTQAGSELYTVASAAPIPDFMDHILENMLERNNWRVRELQEGAD